MMRKASAVVSLWMFLCLCTQSQQVHRPAWPKKMGVYLAQSSETIPVFPNELSGYRSQPDKDFWGKPFTTKGTLRVFQNGDWKGIPEFPNTMNGCSSGVFMIRWRSSDRNIRIQTSSANSSRVASGSAKPGASFGYIYGTNCEQPLFKFGDSHDGGNLVDIFYELKFWQAAP